MLTRLKMAVHLDSRERSGCLHLAAALVQDGKIAKLEIRRIDLPGQGRLAVQIDLSP